MNITRECKMCIAAYIISQQATELHEASRETVRQFINARTTNEVIFTGEQRKALTCLSPVSVMNLWKKEMKLSFR